jgi:hypothetical protein
MLSKEMRRLLRKQEKEREKEKKRERKKELNNIVSLIKNNVKDKAAPVVGLLVEDENGKQLLNAEEVRAHVPSLTGSSASLLVHMDANINRKPVGVREKEAAAPNRWDSREVNVFVTVEMINRLLVNSFEDVKFSRTQIKLEEPEDGADGDGVRVDERRCIHTWTIGNNVTVECTVEVHNASASPYDISLLPVNKLTLMYQCSKTNDLLVDAVLALLGELCLYGFEKRQKERMDVVRQLERTEDEESVIEQFNRTEREFAPSQQDAQNNILSTLITLLSSQYYHVFLDEVDDSRNSQKETVITVVVDEDEEIVATVNLTQRVVECPKQPDMIPAIESVVQSVFSLLSPFSLNL